jgi:hypothetical protein
LYRTVDALRRVLYVQAGVWAVVGLALAIVPGLVLVTWFGQPAIGETAWIRLLGVQMVGLGLLMVLVAHRAEELWWWSWAFAFTDVAVMAVVVLNLAFGLSPEQSAALWWMASVVTVGLALWMLYALWITSRERPIPE